MIKSLKEARITDVLPEILAKQDWVIALAEARRRSHDRIMRYAEESQIYTALDTCSEQILDALAVNLKIDWYDTSYDVEQKRRIIKSCIETRKVMGTVRAVKLQMDAIYPGSTMREWFEIGGPPGTFDVDMAAMPDDLNELERFFNVIEYTKKKTSHFRRMRIVLEGDIDGADLMEGRLDPDPFGVPTIYHVIYHGGFEVNERIGGDEGEELHFELVFFGGVTYDGEVCYDGTVRHNSSRRYNLAFVDDENAGGFTNDINVGNATVLTRSVNPFFHNGARKYNGLINYDTINEKEVLS